MSFPEDCYFIELQQYRVRLTVPGEYGGGLLVVETQSIIYIDADDHLIAETIMLVPAKDVERLGLNIVGTNSVNFEIETDEHGMTSGQYWVLGSATPVDTTSTAELSEKLLQVRKFLRKKSLRRHPMAYTQSKIETISLYEFGDEAENKLESLGKAWRGYDIGNFRYRDDMVEVHLTAEDLEDDEELLIPYDEEGS